MNFFRKKTSPPQQKSAAATGSNNESNSSKQNVSLKIEVQTASCVTLSGDSRRPLIYNSTTMPRDLEAVVTFETPTSYAADEIEILFSVSANSRGQIQSLEFSDGVVPVESVKYFTKHRWVLPLTNVPSSSSSQGLISPGRYTRLVHASLDPTWPSSCTHPRGCIRYTLQVRALSSNYAPRTIATQDIWVINRNVPAHLDTTITTDLKPYVVTDLWKKRTLPVSVTLPSQYLSLGQVVPITFNLSPFERGSKFEHQVAHVVGAQFVLKEASPVYIKATKEPIPTKDVMAIALNDGWPSSGEGWTRTVNLTLPGTPELSTSIAAEVLYVHHSLVVTMKIKTGGARQVEEFKMTLNIQIVGPMPQPSCMHVENDDVQVPHYDDVPHSSQDGHPGEELPSYV